MKRQVSNTRRKQKKYRKNFINTGYGYTTLSLRRPSTMPDSMFVALDYAEVIDSVTAAAATNDQVFRGNAPNDPYVTGTGHQPSGYDQFSAFYQRVRAYACGIEVTCIDVGGPAAFFCIVPNADVTSFTNADDAVEAVRSKCTKWLATASRTSEKLKHYCTTREVLGLTKREIDDDTTASTTGGLPGKIWFWHVIYHCNSGTVNYALRVKLTYYLEFYSRVALTAS